MVKLPVQVSALSVVIKEGRLLFDLRQEWSIPSFLDFLQDYKDCEDKKSISHGKRNPEKDRSANSDAVTDGSDWPTPSACPSELLSSSIPPAPPLATQIDSSGPPGQWFQEDEKKNKIPEKSEFQGQPSDWTPMLEPWHCISGFTGSKKNWILYDEFAEKVEKSRFQKLIKTPIQQQRGPTPELDAPALETKIRNAEEALKRHEQEALVRAGEAKAKAEEVQAKAEAEEEQAKAEEVQAKSEEVQAKAEEVQATAEEVQAQSRAATENGETWGPVEPQGNPRDGKECKQQ